MESTLDLNGSMTGKVVKNQKGQIFNFTTNESSAYHIPGTPDDKNERLIIVPLMVHNTCIGAIVLSRMDSDFLPVSEIVIRI